MYEIDKTNLTDQTKIRVNKITKTENYFLQEINERKWYSKKLSKYVTVFDYIDKILIDLGAITGGVSIIPFISVVGAPVGIASFTLFFSLTTRIIKKLLSTTKKKGKSMTTFLCWLKVNSNSIENLVPQPLINMEIRHEEFIAIFKD